MKIPSAAAVVLTTLILGNPAPVLAANAPLGFTIMCAKHPAECRGGGESQIAATDAVMTTLARINSEVNGSIRPRSDGKADVWTVNASAGDCEDYVLAKRRQLIRSGIPASALRIAYVKTRDGQDHALLVVNTDSGELVLDNLTRVIKPLRQTRYRIIAIQTANPKQWI